MEVLINTIKHLYPTLYNINWTIDELDKYGKWVIYYELIKTGIIPKN